MSRPGPLRRFLGNDSGAALVEFALLLPSFLVFLAISVEGARVFWSYQTTITGVRDAARFLSRAAPRDICASPAAIADWNTRLAEIVRDTQGGDTLFPMAVTIDTVSASLVCGGSGLRGGDAPVATVTANLSIDYPFQGMLRFAGAETTRIRTTVSDSTRVIGG
ncbi:TadE/TadG family type IV pilus assembly protein [Puniceibacterium confluentis]|uniref:TadE/TadG family type IV pilus assembly protein n=1 Tax=Puniceibacterium confluentis TaxID=1958944 RepID=UPI0011B448BD|nr:TadE/TadG family type IV pilus assembly protein [Puniceibacterium confluentis]